MEARYLLHSFVSSVKLVIYAKISDSPVVLDFAHQTSWQESDGVTIARGSNYRCVRNNVI